MAVAVAALPFLPCDDVDVRPEFSCPDSSTTRQSRSLDRVSSSDDCCVSSDCPSEEDGLTNASAVTPPLPLSPSVPSSDSPLSPTPESDPASPTSSIVAHLQLVFAEEFADRATVEDEEGQERFVLFAPLETLERLETERMERTVRDEIKKARALYMRSVLATAPHRGHGPSVWPRHQSLPPPRFHPCMPYTGTQPVRSILRKRDAAEGEAREDDVAAKRADRRVAVTDCVSVQAGVELPETDGELASAQWRSISMYAPVRHMVMTSLKARYGADASDPEGWMSTVEGYAWLDEIFCAVKDAYQMLHNAEAAEWMEILEQDRLVRRPDWWGRLGFLWA